MTKRKISPHLKRGPKPKPRQPEPPKGKVGRPEIPLRVRPDRYVLAYCKALVNMGFSRRGAAVVLAAMYKGPVTVTTVDKGFVDAEQRMRHVSVSISVPVPTDFDLGEFAKEAERLRALVKWHAARPDDLAWLKAMSEAVRIAFERQPDARDTALRLAASVGEAAWLHEVLLPMLDEETAVPELADNFSPT